MLDVQEISVSYGGVQAVRSVSMSIQRGELVGLIGANGAGKTSFIDAVTGFAAASGTVTVNGIDVSQMSPHLRARNGLGRTWQGGELFDDISVSDNLCIGFDRVTTFSMLRDAARWRKRSTPPRVNEILELLKLADVALELPTALPQGQRKLVGVGRALAASPLAVFLDEPAAGLSTTESAQLGATLRAIASSGTASLLVEHDVNLVMSVCDRVYVLERGELIAHGTPSEVRSNQKVIDAYLGPNAHDAPAGDIVS